MIRRIQALNYRCLRHVDVALDRFQVLVGPNASGKSTLFDVVSFLADLVRDGLESAIERRTSNFQDLVWGRPNEQLGFEMALEFDVPDDLKDSLPPDKSFEIFRYEVAIEENKKGVAIRSERGLLLPKREVARPQKEIFPLPLSPVTTILLGGRQPGGRSIVSKSSEGKDNYSIEVSPKSGKGWTVSISFGPHRSALGNLPESPERFPVATRVKRLLETKVKRLFLDSAKMRSSSPPELRRNGLSFDGGNLPWAIEELRQSNRESFSEWLAHVQTTLDDIWDIRVIDREDNRHAHLALQYGAGVEIPSWTASDGTLRFLALTVIPYLEETGNIYLLEEPENGIHPLALQAVYDSLASAYESQALIATHSPVFLSLARPSEILCFAKDEQGATDIIRGDDHPMLRDWQETQDLSLLFATGVIG